MKASNKNVANKKIKVVNDINETVDDMTVAEVLDNFDFSEEPLLKDVTTIYRRLDYLEMETEKEGRTHSDYYQKTGDYWTFNY